MRGKRVGPNRQVRIIPFGLMLNYLEKVTTPSSTLYPPSPTFYLHMQILFCQSLASTIH